MTIKNLFPGQENTLETVVDGLSRKIAAYNENLMIVDLMSGKFEFTVGDKTYIVGAGDSLYKQPNIEHGATCLEAGTLLDVFTPHREDFLRRPPNTQRSNHHD